MESLQVSFQRVVDAGMFNGISLDPSLYLSHMFYADDAIFVGQWNESNINTIVHILDRFLRASRLRINMSKSKLLGISMDADKVGQAARKIGNGADTLFWEDAWRGGTAFKYLFPKVYALESSKNIVVASKMAHCNLGYSFRRDPRGSVEKAQFDSMLEKVEGTLLADMRDRCMWSLEGSGDFSVASVRKLLDGNMLPEVASKTWWIKAMPNKARYRDLPCAHNEDDDRNESMDSGPTYITYTFAPNNKYDGGLDSEEAYPYTGVDGVCKYSSENAAIRVLETVNITVGAQDELKHAVGVVRPVSVAFQVSGNFKQYTGGVYTSDNCGSDPMDVNHAVVAVGYGEENGVPYSL
ncbi:RNA-directed DNA polymerase, eukaryota, reverse transcriptase zinc-binding domain protein [Tanacetum coccineum]|uniref:RNA-directed DNA polymerase, eukaryota, reverse transcriptase zinc-binding domain protein n=1 Tax=Tanacetum coccineum TaxID=301880 RepID=A0ABQ5B4L2_9ASTR